jgi:hypothetical protein
MYATATKQAMKEETDEVEQIEEATPPKNTDIADKDYLKHKPGTVKGTMKQLGRFLRGKPEIKEETIEEKNESHTHAAHYENEKGEWTGMNLLVAKNDEDAIKQAHEKCKEGCRLSRVERHTTVKEEIELEEDGPGRKWRQGPPLLKSRAVGSARYGTDAEAKYPDEKRTWVARGYEGDQKEPVNRAGRNKEDPLASRANIKSASKGTAKTNRTLKQAIKSTLNKEEVEQIDEIKVSVEKHSAADATMDMLRGRVTGASDKEKGGTDSFRRWKIKLAGDGEQRPGHHNDNVTEPNLDNKGETRERQKITTNPGPVDVKFDDKLGDKPPQSYFSKQKQIKNEEIEEAKDPHMDAGVGAQPDFATEKVIAGTPGWKKMSKDIKDKSGAIHTPMSRAKDLAHSAFKNIQSKTKIK